MSPLAVVLALISMTVTPSRGTSPAPVDDPRLAFMGGCWELRSSTRFIQEQWMTPMAGQMMGMGRTMVRDTIREFEYMRIEQRGSVPTFIALPANQPPAEFPAIHVDSSSVLFENKTHDFPQQISYRRVGADSLLARISGTVNGRSRAVDFAMRRARCG